MSARAAAEKALDQGRGEPAHLRADRKIFGEAPHRPVELGGIFILETPNRAKTRGAHRASRAARAGAVGPVTRRDGSA